MEEEQAPIRIEQEFEMEAESGGVDQSADVIDTGDNSNQCAALLPDANTGNLQNGQEAVQYLATGDGDIEIGGSTVTAAPEQAATCDRRSTRLPRPVARLRQRVLGRSWFALTVRCDDSDPYGTMSANDEHGRD